MSRNVTAAVVDDVRMSRLMNFDAIVARLLYIPPFIAVQRHPNVPKYVQEFTHVVTMSFITAILNLNVPHAQS